MELTSEEKLIVALVAARSAQEERKNTPTTECISTPSTDAKLPPSNNGHRTTVEGGLPWVTQPLFWKYSKRKSIRVFSTHI